MLKLPSLLWADPTERHAPLHDFQQKGRHALRLHAQTTIAIAATAGLHRRPARLPWDFPPSPFGLPPAHFLQRPLQHLRSQLRRQRLDFHINSFSLHLVSKHKLIYTILYHLIHRF